MTRRIALGLLALALSLPIPAFAQAGAGNLRAQIEKVGQAKLMVPGSETGSDGKTIQKLIAGDIALGGKLALTTDDVVGFGDYALETGHWVATAADGKHLDHGPYLTFYKKADGGWKIYRDIWNSSMPAK